MPVCLGTICAGMFRFLVCLVGFRSMQGPFLCTPCEREGVDFQDSIPPHLLGLEAEVKQTLFLARADGTVRTYLGGFNYWKWWAVERRSLFADKFVPRCNVFTSHFAKCFFCFPYQRHSLQYRLGLWVGWLPEGFFSLYGPVRDECV